MSHRMTWKFLWVMGADAGAICKDDEILNYDGGGCNETGGQESEGDERYCNIL